MRIRWPAACVFGWLLAAPAVAQEPRAASPVSYFEAAPPAELPPLLAVPPPGAPRPAGPRGPGGEYDPGYFYLPERAPEVSRRPDECGPAGRVWLAPALELGWNKSAHVPALVRLGSPTGPVVYGDERLRAPFRAGFGLAGGFWLGDGHAQGFDGSYYTLTRGGNDTLVFPENATLLLPTANGGTFPLSNPAADLGGAYQAGLTTRFTSADANSRTNLWCRPNGRLDWLAGYRYAHLAEDFEVYGKRIGPTNDIVRFRDDARARNDFHGGQIGLAGEYRAGRWYVTGTGKVAFGAVFTHTELDGKFRVNTVVVPSGFYARPGLAGDREYTRYGVMPTVGLTFGRQLGDHARAFVGYNFLYLNNVTRGPDVLDPTPPVLAANPQAAQPLVGNRRDAATSDFWVQSLSLGLEWRY